MRSSLLLVLLVGVAVSCVAANQWVSCGEGILSDIKVYNDVDAAKGKAFYLTIEGTLNSRVDGGDLHFINKWMGIKVEDLHEDAVTEFKKNSTWPQFPWQPENFPSRHFVWQSYNYVDASYNSGTYVSREDFLAVGGARVFCVEGTFKLS